MEPIAAILATALAALGDVLSDEQTKRLVPLAVATIGVVLLMLSLRRRQQQVRRAAREGAPEPRPARIDPQLHRDLDELMVELQELSRKISAEIDTRFAKLEAAMRDADRRIAVLNRLARSPESAAEATPAMKADLDSRHQVVCELAAAGFTSVEIARDLGKTPGEVELILNLRKRLEPVHSEVKTEAENQG